MPLRAAVRRRSDSDAGRPKAAGWIAAIVALGATPAHAVNCTLGVQGVTFGSYDTLSAQNTDSAGGVSVSCDSSDTFTIALSSGHGTMLSRQMQSGAYSMAYNLYTDSLRSIIWGDGTSGTTLVSTTGTSATYEVYGRIPAAQNLPAGSYNDSIIVTLTF
jgi:spore coat protein U domain-containing protein, fimbrial subunit CupE1/2/3/6